MLAIHKNENAKLATGITLIFLCCLLHHCDLTSVFRLHPVLLSKAFSEEYVQSPQTSEIWVWVTVAGRILGAICIYKIIKLYGFFKSLLFTCLGHAVVSLFMMMLALAQQSSFSMYYNTLLSVRFLYSFFTPSAFTVSAMYCFQITPSKYHALLSVCAALIWPLTGIISRYFAESTTNMSFATLYLFFFISALASLVLYALSRLCLKDVYVQNFSQIPTRKTAWSIYLFLFSLGAICSVGTFYPSYVFRMYITDVLIISPPLAAYLHWALLLISLPISGFITNKIGFVKSLSLSLLGLIAVASLLWLVPYVTVNIYLCFQVSFVMFFSLFLAQVYFMIYKVARKIRSIYLPVIPVVIGFSTATVLGIYVNKLRLPINLPTLSTLMLSFMIAICLIIITRYRFFNRYR
jgi:hypothetical protein